jgi:hypothetical protein
MIDMTIRARRTAPILVALILSAMTMRRSPAFVFLFCV